MISKIGNKVYASQLWYEITHNLDGKHDDRKPNEYHTVDYNILYRNTITNIICDKFGASREHKKDGKVLVFDVEKLLKIGSLYDLNDNIQVKEITGMEDSGELKGEGCESSEGYIVCPVPLYSFTNRYMIVRLMFSQLSPIIFHNITKYIVKCYKASKTPKAQFLKPHSLIPQSLHSTFAKLSIGVDVLQQIICTIKIDELLQDTIT